MAIELRRITNFAHDATIGEFAVSINEAGLSEISCLEHGAFAKTRGRYDIFPGGAGFLQSRSLRRRLFPLFL